MSEMTPHAEGAAPYALTIRRILECPIAYDPAQEIVYRERRLTYADLRARVHRLAGALAALGVKRGDTVAVLDWDSHRYLEAFFAVPMMGAVLHTVNVRLSPEQILHTIEHAEDDVVLVHADFVPILEAIRGRISAGKKLVLVADEPAPPTSHTLAFEGEYEALLAAAPPRFEFPDLPEETRATTFYTTGTTGLPKGVFFSHRQLVLHTLGLAATLAAQHHASFRRGDVYMPITPMFHVHAWGIPYVATLLGVKQVYPGRYVPEALLALVAEEKVTFSHCVPTVLHMILKAAGAEKVDLSRWKRPCVRGLPSEAIAEIVCSTSWRWLK
jgi:fatty-acyl-CoA synthase